MRRHARRTQLTGQCANRPVHRASTVRLTPAVDDASRWAASAISTNVDTRQPHWTTVIKASESEDLALQEQIPHGSCVSINLSGEHNHVRGISTIHLGVVDAGDVFSRRCFREQSDWCCRAQRMPRRKTRRMRRCGDPQRAAVPLPPTAAVIEDASNSRSASRRSRSVPAQYANLARRQLEIGL